jgi:hypothetical protein
MFRPARGHLQAFLARGLESYGIYNAFFCLRDPVVTKNISNSVHVLCYSYFVERSIGDVVGVERLEILNIGCRMFGAVLLCLKDPLAYVLIYTQRDGLLQS